jgi:hypothetical protein
MCAKAAARWPRTSLKRPEPCARTEERIEVDEQTAALVTDALVEAEWTEHGGGTRTCLGCHHSWAFPAEGHKKDCRVDAALTALGLPDEASRDRRRTELWQADQVTRHVRVIAGPPLGKRNASG